MTHLVLFATLFCSLVPTFALQVNASAGPLSINESEHLKVVLTISPNITRRGGVMTITVKVENETGPVFGASVKVLLTFSDGRQILISGVTDTNGALTYIARVPLGISPGPGKVDVIVRMGNEFAMRSSLFTVK